MFRRHLLIFDKIRFPGGHRSRVTPVPIPNTEVKPATADGTAWVTVWESRSLPGLFLEGRINRCGPFSLEPSVISFRLDRALRSENVVLKFEAFHLVSSLG